MDVRITHTVAYLLRCPPLDKSENRSKQMTIRRSLAAQKATGGKLVPPPDVIDTVTAGTTTVSPLTNQMSTVRGGPSTPPTTPPRTPTTPTTPSGTWPTRPKPKQRLIRKLAGGMQKFRINKLAASDHEKRALKRATTWYAKEKKKPVDCRLFR